VRPGDELADIIEWAAARAGFKIKDGDVIAIASKMVSKALGRVVELAKVRTSARARRLAKKFSIPAELCQLILRESGKVLGGVPGALLTINGGILIANAGIDRKNAPRGSAVLWPKNPHRVADSLRLEIESRVGKKVGLIIVDSRLSPMRLGTTGIALAASGFRPVQDYRGKSDREGRRIRLTVHSLADDLASAAHLVMGEGDEGTPIAIMRGSPIVLDGRVGKLTIPEDRCIYMSAFRGLRRT